MMGKNNDDNFMSLPKTSDNRTLFTHKIWIWCSWLCVTLFYAYQYILRIYPSVILEDIKSRYHVNLDDLGYFSAAYYIGYGLMHLPYGFLYNRYPASILVVGSLILASIGTLPFYIDLGWTAMIIGRCIVGCASASAILGVFKVIRSVFPTHHFGRMLGFSVAIGLLGALYGGQGLRHFFDLYALETVINVIIFAGIALACFSYISLRMIEKRKLLVVDSSKRTAIMTSLKSVLSVPRFLLICCISGLMVGPLEGFADVWIIPYLDLAYGFPSESALMMQGLIFLFMGVGSPALAAWAEGGSKHVPMLILCAIIMTVCFCLIQFTLIPPQLVYGSCIILGFFSAYQVLVMHVVSTRVPVVHVSIASALANMIIMSFGFFFHSAIAVLLKITERYLVQDLLTHYTISLSIIPLGLVLGGATFWYLWKFKGLR